MDSLAMHGGEPVIKGRKGVFRWPQYKKEDEAALIEQLHSEVSIYDKAGVIKEFEEIFAESIGAQHSLLSNSGTSAIFSMFEGIGLNPGDEVLSPVYTFHATVSPMMYTGASPVFCDCDDYGNITLSEIKKRITPKTKAVIISHMWGMPVADAPRIAEFCKKQGIFMLEDCSHAHGAVIDGKPVGSFGDAAAWSLQGQKTVTGGEGGIMVTNSSEVFYRALLQGHYNKRPKNEIPKDHPLHDYYQTGLGQKFRAHPLAIRLALRQFEKTGQFLLNRQKAASILVEAVANYPFLRALTPPERNTSSWYSLVLRFDQKKSFGVSRQNFVDALVAEGLIEADIPGSTGPLNEMPLFTRPNQVLGRLYDKPSSPQKGFKNAYEFHDQIIKLPVWTFPEEIGVVEAYAKGLNKVSSYLLTNKSL